MYTDIYNTHLKKTDMQDEQDQFFFVPSFIPGIIEFIYINGILLNTNETTKFQCNNYNISFIHSIAHWFAPIFSCRALGGVYFFSHGIISVSGTNNSNKVFAVNG